MDCIQSGGERRETRACTVVACSEEAPGQAETHLTSEDIERVRKLQRNQQKYKIAPPGQKYDEETFLQDRREFGETCRCVNSEGCSPVPPYNCICKAGWTGEHCEIPQCRPGCGLTGTCVRPDVCSCQPGYTGARCEQAV